MDPIQRSFSAVNFRLVVLQSGLEFDTKELSTVIFSPLQNIYDKTYDGKCTQRYNGHRYGKYNGTLLLLYVRGRHIH